MTGIGVDLTDIRRVRRYVDASPSFVVIAWTDREREQCQGRVDRLASRWAAKEAVMKALGTGLGRTSPDDIEIVTDDAGRPTVHLLGDTAALFPSTDVKVSMTREGPWSIAVAIATPVTSQEPQ